MMKVPKILLLILATVSLAACDCPAQSVHAIGYCSYNIRCNNDIRGIQIRNECRESANHPVAIDLTLTNPVDGFQSHVDHDFLNIVTTFKIFGRWQVPDFNIFQYMMQLQNLYIVNAGIEHISGVPFYNLHNLQTLSLSHNRLKDISELFQFETGFNKLKKLILSHNSIEEIAGETFEELTLLVELDLSYNLISDLTEEPFFNLTSLEVLRLNNNRIKDLNGAVNNLLNLKHLYLRGNQIENIDEESLKVIKHLETFDVSGNQLEQIKPVMFSRHWDHFANHSVCKIILSENQITNIPNATSKEISMRFVRHLGSNPVDILTELDLSKNSISNIEYNAFQSLVRLVSLDLSQNKIITFVVNSEDLACVKYLDLSGNYISNLYFDNFATMKELQKLVLSYNRLDYIPDLSFNDNHNLRLVNMTYNEIEKLDKIHITMFHQAGGVLDLSNNGLYMLRIPSGEGIHLFTLLLHSNNITDASLIDLTVLTDLTTLNLSNNLITELNHTSLLLPWSITYLELSHNRIKKLGPSTFKGLNHLVTLRLNRNFLSEVEYGAFQGLTSLSDLDLSFNTIRYLDSKMLMDLKSLKVLSLRSNDMYILDYKYWYGHKLDLTVYIDNNNFSCAWLSRAVADYSNGYSRMQPFVLQRTSSTHSVDGMPCKAESQDLVTQPSQMMADERLLITSQKILEAIKEQTVFMRKYEYVWRALENVGKVDNEV